MRRQELQRAIGALVVLGGVLVACSSSKKSSTPTVTATVAPAGANGPTTTAALTGPPIEIMMVEVLSQGIAGNSYPNNLAAAKAAAAGINAMGGINGSPVVITSCDTHQDAAQEAVCAQKLTASNAIAVAGEGTGRSTALVDATVKNHIANVGTKANGSTQFLAASVTSFPINNPGVSLFACPVAFKQLGALKIGAITIDLAQADLLVGGAKAVIANTPGTSFTTQTKVSLDATDYAAPVQTAIGNGAEGVITAFGRPSLISTIKANNNRLKICTSDGLLSTKDLIDLGAAADGFIGMSSIPPGNLLTGSAGKQFLADAAAYEKATGDGYMKPEAVVSTDVNAWMSVRAIAQVAKTITGPVTRESLFQAFSKTTNLDFPGILPRPIDFTKTNPVPTLARAFLTSYDAYQWNAKTKAFVKITSAPADVVKLLTGT